MLLVYYISISVADTLMSKLYFNNSYFSEEFFVVEAFDHFIVSKKQH